MKYAIVTASAISLCLTAGAAHAQDTSAEPTYETVTLSGGFTPDPYMIDLSSGGSVDASGIGCSGYIANAPDVRLYFDGGSLPLIVSATSAEDTTLVINGPDGKWYCNDDSELSLDPTVSFDAPISGRYEIWVGSYGGSELHAASLAISEVRSVAGGGTSVQAAAGPDTNADPIYENVRLSSGFTPDPYIVRMSSGGSNDASLINGACRGYIASAPDVRLNFDAGSLPLIISAASMADTTLVINAPNGQWYCDDDSGQGTNPMVRFQTPLSGRYEIWVGTYGGAETHSAELNISELYSE